MTRKTFGPVLVGAMALFTLAVYPLLPDRIPVHWNLWGEVDGWTGKWPGAFVAPALALGVWLLLQVLPKVDPRRRNYERFQETYWVVVNMVIGFIGLVHVLSLGTALGWPIGVPRVILVLVGVLFVALGNYLPRLRPNWWMGIRTPWTLENDRVWRDTHRLGGKTFVAAGLVMMVSAFLPPAFATVALVAAMVLGAGVPLVYSYVLWRREQRRV
jgi:uncharacterized membrane protein